MKEEIPGYKLLLSYEVNHEKIYEYRQFVTTTYVPSMGMLGFQMSEAWHTAYGTGPDHLVGFVCESRDTMTDLIESEKWLDMNAQLQKYVTKFSYKVVPYRQQFQF